MDTSKRNGFTLIELLICMVVIGILSVAMLMASEEVQSSAKAAQIINDLNAWKKAALEYWADNQDEISKPDFNFWNAKDDVMKYISNVDKESLEKAEQYKLRWRTAQNKDGSWYIFCDIGQGSGNATNGVQAKLMGRAKTAGLLNGRGDYKSPDDWATLTDAQLDQNIYNGAYGSGRYIAIKIR